MVRPRPPAPCVDPSAPPPPAADVARRCAARAEPGGAPPLHHPSSLASFLLFSPSFLDSVSLVWLGLVTAPVRWAATPVIRWLGLPGPPQHVLPLRLSERAGVDIVRAQPTALDFAAPATCAVRGVCSASALGGGGRCAVGCSPSDPSPRRYEWAARGRTRTTRGPPQRPRQTLTHPRIRIDESPADPAPKRDGVCPGPIRLPVPDAPVFSPLSYCRARRLHAHPLERIRFHNLADQVAHLASRPPHHLASRHHLVRRRQRLRLESQRQHPRRPPLL